MIRLRVRPHLVLLVIAGLLLLTAHLSSKEFTTSEEILVRSSFMPVVVQVSTHGETRSWTMGPFQDVETGMHGPATVTIAPAIPGTQLLIAFGPTAAFVPLVVLTCIAALLFRILEKRGRSNDQDPAARPLTSLHPRKRETGDLLPQRQESSMERKR